jgi:hypothetical protein
VVFSELEALFLENLFEVFFPRILYRPERVGTEQIQLGSRICRFRPLQDLGDAVCISLALLS